MENNIEASEWIRPVLVVTSIDDTLTGGGTKSDGNGGRMGPS